MGQRNEWPTPVLAEGRIKQLGEPVSDNVGRPDPVYLNQVLMHSLAANGYLPATETAPSPRW